MSDDQAVAIIAAIFLAADWDDGDNATAIAQARALLVHAKSRGGSE